LTVPRETLAHAPGVDGYRWGVSTTALASRAKITTWWRRVGPGPALGAAAGLGAAAVLRLHDPHVAGSYGTCFLLEATGIPCPACGGLRAVSDLTRGDLVSGLGSNAYVVLTVAAVATWWMAWVASRLAGRPAPAERHVVALVVGWGVGFVLFGLLRLLPGLDWLRP